MSNMGRLTCLSKCLELEQYEWLRIYQNLSEFNQKSTIMTSRRRWLLQLQLPGKSISAKLQIDDDIKATPFPPLFPLESLHTCPYDPYYSLRLPYSTTNFPHPLLHLLNANASGKSIRSEQMRLILSVILASACTLLTSDNQIITLL